MGHWLTRIAPLGWARMVRPFAGERWWLLAVPAGVTLILASVAVALSERRDIAAGLRQDHLKPDLRHRPLWSRVCQGMAPT
jgi:ABC-2 type transport system permease protein